MRDLLASIFITATACLMGQAADHPVPIIFDTDMGGDCDDVGALFILHGAVERGEARLVATMGCVSSEAIAPCIDAINRWFGRSEIPVGTLKDPGFLPEPGYPVEIAKNFPHRFPSSIDYPDAVALYRQVLAAQPDGSVVIVAVGPLRNLGNLLKSRPDAASPLDGPALVARKVKKLEVMGGKYPPHASKDAGDGEYNFIKDPASTALVCNTWPTPILFSGEGGSTNSGRRVTYEMPEHSPLTMAYANYPGTGFAGDRLSWDPVSCLVAVRGAAPWYEVVSGGGNFADAATGINTWKAGESRNHSYLVLKAPKPEVETALENLMVAGKGRPAEMTNNTAYYARDGMCRITSSGAADSSTAAEKAVDRDARSAWLNRADTSWIKCQYADGRIQGVTSYAVVCADRDRLPRALEFSGSNDNGGNWTLLDQQETPGFTGETSRREFTIAKPAKWNLYRLSVAAANASEGVRISTVELNQSIRCLPEITVSNIAIDPSTLVIPADGRATLNATLWPIDTFERQVVWASNDPSVAEVKNVGEQTAIVAGKKAGACTVTANIGNVRRTCEVTVTPSTLRPDWSFDEIGSPPIPGAVAVAGGRFTLTGCGHSMTSWWQRVRDQGAFVSKSLADAGVLSARLTNLGPNVGGPAYQWDHRPPTAAGLMLRESLSEPSSRYFLVQVEASGNLVCRWRDKTGDVDDNQRKELGKVSLPLHLKLVTKDQQIQVFRSKDGNDWDGPLISRTAAFDETSRLGLFTCSGNTFSSTTAIFEAVQTAK